VLDTNVVVSALLLARSVPRQAFDKAIIEGTVLVSLPLLAELAEVLGRKQFDKYLLEEERTQFLIALLSRTELVEPAEKITECRDSKDNKFLELAVSGKQIALLAVMMTSSS
jgi:putative PIN family toxin of toxin-antitoxin system